MIDTAYLDQLEAHLDEGGKVQPSVIYDLIKALCNPWQPIETAPKDGTVILVWHNDASDAYWMESDNRLTVYGAWCEGLSRLKEPGMYLATWGGSYKDDESGEGWGPFTYMPDWWFTHDSEFEQPLAPTYWMPLPSLPKEGDI